MEDVDAVLARAKRGSPEAFTELYQHLVRPVAGYLRSKGVLEVEDVTSEVFLAVFAGVASFDGDAERFRSWVFTIAHRRSVDYWRRVGRTPPTAPLEPTDDGGVARSAEALALDSIGEQQALALLDTLSPDQREVLLLRIIGDLTVEQVAEVVGKSPGAVKALQHRGLARLRRLLKGVTL
jgi:RNA polymerase sigma-70 factor (ECF subfamily)